MKSFAAFLLFAILASPCMANSVRIKLFNNSNCTIRGTDLQIHNGDFPIRDHGNPLYNKSFPPGSYAELYTGTASAFCGTDGYVEFQTEVAGKTYQIAIHFNNPYIGSNAFNGVASSPFVIKHLGGGDGADAMVSYELTGGPKIDAGAPPPPPVIELPTTGNRVVSGTISWSIDTTGQPEEADLSQAFLFTVTAPARLLRNANGGASYQDTKGTFDNIFELKDLNVTFTDSRTEARRDGIGNIMAANRSVKYIIHNLPDGLPINIVLRPASLVWKPGIRFTEKPPGTPLDAKWVVFLQETLHTEVRINYVVYGSWFDTDGKYAGGPSPGKMPGFLADLKNRPIRSTFGASPNDLPGVERDRRLQINREQTPIGRDTRRFTAPQTRPASELRGK